ncbi:lipopolysaccharide biosynthesis protein [Mycolicibacterium pulveris]|uniref:lipopolysaccharide biosynthesis protein n=1 Tax=Mycolicibacterium pulveris TaxID=36813 RepID=UPI0021F2811B|nr:oligosaccharide flippase family protein [Mycolicibacterium pulveris]
MTALFGRGILRLAQFVAFLFLARLMSPAEFGWFGIITTTIGIAGMLGSLGLRQAFAYEIGQHYRSSGEAAGTALAVWLPLAAATTAVVYLLYGRELPRFSPPEAAAMIMLGVSTLLLLMFCQGIFLGRGDIRAYTISETIPRLVLMAVVILCAAFIVIDLQVALWAFSGGTAVAAVYSVYVVLQDTDKIATRFRRFSVTVRYGLISAVNASLVALSARLSMFVIEHYSDAAAAGTFYAAARVNETILEAATVVGMVLFSNAARQNKHSGTFTRNAKIASWMLWLFFVLGGVVALAAPLVITALVGSDYAAAVPALQILALSFGPTAATRVIYPTLSGSGAPHFGTPIIIFSLVVNTVLAMVMVPTMGINGGAIAMVVGQFVLFFGYVIACRTNFGINIRDLLLPRRKDVQRMFVYLSRKYR